MFANYRFLLDAAKSAEEAKEREKYWRGGTVGVGLYAIVMTIIATASLTKSPSRKKRHKRK